MSGVYDYIAANFPVALMTIMLVPLAFVVVWRVVVRIFNDV